MTTDLFEAGEELDRCVWSLPPVDAAHSLVRGGKCCALVEKQFRIFQACPTFTGCRLVLSCLIVGSKPGLVHDFNTSIWKPPWSRYGVL